MTIFELTDEVSDIEPENDHPEARTSFIPRVLAWREKIFQIGSIQKTPGALLVACTVTRTMADTMPGRRYYVGPEFTPPSWSAIVLSDHCRAVRP